MKYATPLAFKAALKAHLQKLADGDAALFARRQKLIVFDRFLARVVDVLGDTVILKGGLVLELRLERARVTKDIDLRLIGPPDRVLERLQEAGRLDLNDWMEFEVSPAKHPDIANPGMKYQGHRFQVVCKIAAKPYANFGVDVAFADPLVGQPDTIVAPNSLGFAGVAPPTLRIYPVVSHVAEKLHAYTLPRDKPNMRVRDLPDIALLSTVGDIAAVTLRDALRRTFEFRNTHELPVALPEPPRFWDELYAKLANESDLEWRTLADAYTAAAAFLDPVLRGEDATWSATSRAWSP